MEIINFFNQGWVGIVSGIVSGFVISIIFYRAPRNPKLAYQHFSKTVITEVPEPNNHRITVIFDNIEVERIVTTEIIIWNSGNAALKSDAIVEPICFDFGESAQILSASIVNVTNPANKASLSFTEEPLGLIKCAFSFLDEKDGFAIRIVHSGKLAPSVACTIIGMKRGVKHLGEFQRRQRPVSRVKNRDTMAKKMIGAVADFVGSPEFPLVVAMFITIPMGLFVLTLPPFSSVIVSGNLATWWLFAAVYIIPPLAAFATRPNRFPRSLYPYDSD